MTIIFLVLFGMLAFTDAPRLSDADKTELLIAHRDFLSTMAHINQIETQCKAQTDAATKTAIDRRDALQAIVKRLTVKGYVLNLDKLTYEEAKQ